MPKKPMKGRPKKRPLVPGKSAPRLPAFADGYDHRYAEVAGTLCANGATDREVAEELGIGVERLYRWRANHAELAAAMTLGKEHAISRVERSLYARAVGYTFDEKQSGRRGVESLGPQPEHDADFQFVSGRILPRETRLLRRRCPTRRPSPFIMNGDSVVEVSDRCRRSRRYCMAIPALTGVNETAVDCTKVI